MLVAGDSQSVAVFLDRWLGTVQPRLAAKTAHEWRRALDHYVVPRIGQVELQKLTAADLSGLYAGLLTSGGQGGRPLSPTTVRSVHTRLRSALKDAVRWKLLERSPAEDADPPPAKQVASARRRALKVWSADELNRFLAATRDHRWHVVWTLSAFTGLRRSELLGLCWRDVDGSTLTVRQKLVEDDHSWRLVEDTKTGTSARTIHLGSHVIGALRTHAKGQAEARLAAGPAWADLGLVLSDELGRPLSPPAVSQAFRRAVRDVGLRPIRFHGLRHTHATLMLRAGVSPKVVSERLGHASVAFTLDTYASVLPGMQPEAADRLEALVLGAADLNVGQPSVSHDSSGDVVSLPSTPL